MFADACSRTSSPRRPSFAESCVYLGRLRTLRSVYKVSALVISDLPLVVLSTFQCHHMRVCSSRASDPCYRLFLRCHIYICIDGISVLVLIASINMCCARV